MLEALWSVEFVSNVEGAGAGVAVLETGRVLGGDSSYFYVGTYRMDGSDVRASLRVTHYAGPPNSIFGNAREFTLEVVGRPAHDSFLASGHVAENPALNIAIRLTRRAELP